MLDLYKILLSVTSYIIFVGLIGKLIRNYLNIADPILACLYGILIGPQIGDLMVTDPINSKNILFTFSRITLCLQLMTISLQLPHNYIFRKGKSLIVLLIPCSLISALFTFIILTYFGNYPLKTAWAIASACTPTDPVLSSSIMRGEFANKHISEKIKKLLAAESGLNDGVGILFLYLILSNSQSPKEYFLDYFTNALILKTILSGVTGYLLGFILASMLKFCQRKGFVSRTPITVFGIALSLFCMCIAIFLKQSEFIFILFTGISFSRSEWFVLETRGSQFQILVEHIFNISFFIFFGARIDWQFWSLNIFFVCTAILLIRRPLALILMFKFIPAIKSYKDALVVGWFGPIGVGSLYYATFADDLLNINITPIVSYLVVLSIFVHGLTVPVYLLGVECMKKIGFLKKEDEIFPNLENP